jgi:hypothetical protein
LQVIKYKSGIRKALFNRVGKKNIYKVMINYKGKMYRIDHGSNKIQYSSNNGSSWSTKCSSSSYGDFKHLEEFDGKLYAATSKGVYYSSNDGSSWSSKCTSSSYGEFMSLSAQGDKLFADTSKGLYYSSNKGSSWSKK